MRLVWWPQVPGAALVLTVKDDQHVTLTTEQIKRMRWTEHAKIWKVRSVTCAHATACLDAATAAGAHSSEANHGKGRNLKSGSAARALDVCLGFSVIARVIEENDRQERSKESGDSRWVAVSSANIHPPKHRRWL